MHHGAEHAAGAVETAVRGHNIMMPLAVSRALWIIEEFMFENSGYFEYLSKGQALKETIGASDSNLPTGRAQRFGPVRPSRLCSVIAFEGGGREVAYLQVASFDEER